MEQVLHRGITAGVAAAVASAGLIAVAPAAPPPTLHLQEIEVQLTNVSAADLFPALGDNLNFVGAGLSTGLTDLLQLDLPGTAANFASAVANVVAIPENILVAAVGGLLGQDFDQYFLAAPNLFDLTTWSQVLPELGQVFGEAMGHLWQGVQDLFQGEVANSLLYTLSAGNELFFTIPEMVMFGVPALLDDSLLSLVGL